MNDYLKIIKQAEAKIQDLKETIIIKNQVLDSLIEKLILDNLNK